MTHKEGAILVEQQAAALEKMKSSTPILTPASQNNNFDNGLSTSQSQPQSQRPVVPPVPIPVDRDWITKLLQKYPNPNARRHDKALVCAPMVDQSELPFRLLCRRYGTNLCFTPMIHARLAATSAHYRNKFLGTWLDPEDRPLIAQICGSNPDYVLATAKLVEPYVDGIDINCGCPQGIARKGKYGAFLLEQEETLLTLVKHLVQHLTIPLSVKVRLLPAPEQKGPSSHDDLNDIPKQSLQLYQKLVDAGIHLLTIHGRTRHQKSILTGQADWETIREAVQLLGHRIPIFANGSIQDYDNDVEECLRITGADGVMSSESLLEYPPLFYKEDEQEQDEEIPAETTTVTTAIMPTDSLNRTRRTIGRLQLAYEYMDLARQYPSDQGGQGGGLKSARMHLHRFLHYDIQYFHKELRLRLCTAKSMDELQDCLDTLRRYHDESNHQVADESLSWYRRWRDPPPEGGAEENEDDDDNNFEGDCMDECGTATVADFFDGKENDSGDY